MQNRTTHITKSCKKYFMYSCGFPISYINLSETCNKCCMSGSVSCRAIWHPWKAAFCPQVSQVTKQLDTAARWAPAYLQCGSAGVEMAFIAKTFYDLRATTLEGDSVDFNVLRGRVVLIENVASLWGTTTRDFGELNQLQSKYPHRLVVLGFPCNQFGYQVSWAAWLLQEIQYDPAIFGLE